MKLLRTFTAALLALATSSSSAVRIHIKIHQAQAAHDDICTKSCPSGQYCVRGSDVCSPPPANQCFNPATSRWIRACDPGFTCDNGECVIVNNKPKKPYLKILSTSAPWTNEPEMKMKHKQHNKASLKALGTSAPWTNEPVMNNKPKKPYLKILH